MLVQGYVDGPSTIRIVDATANVNGWEHDMSQDIQTALAAGGLVSERVCADSLKDFSNACTRDSGKYNSLVIICHGGIKDDPDAALIRIGKDPVTSYELLKEYFDGAIADKIVILAVCEGSNVDSAWSFFNIGEGSPLFLIASRCKLSKGEATSFIPAFLTEFSNNSPIDRTCVEGALKKHNIYTHDKMELHP